ncbi:MAG: toll/interleukin-1 receptor domain-containing protein [Coriobacteriales bacterium]|nr:toll/interleukin-1 receptor domain-containing protein [Coriobacteriales bacterium]
MPEDKPKVYEGHRDYVFVSYAHADRNAALPIIRALVDEGYRVWYDDGIQKGSKYPDYIASHVHGWLMLHRPSV